MLSWNVGGVYLVAFAFQAVILVFAIYTLVFLKYLSFPKPEAIIAILFQEKTMHYAAIHEN